MSIVHSRAFSQLSTSYYVVTLSVFFLNCLAAYALLSPDHLTLLWRTVIAILLGSIVAPILLLLLVVTIILLGAAAYIAYSVIIEKIYRTKKLDVTSLKKVLASAFSANDVELPRPDITRRALHTSEKLFSVQFSYADRSIIWQQFDGLTIIRRQADRSNLPQLIIDNTTNNTRSRQFDIAQLGVAKLDLGSDFGNYFNVYAPASSETSAYELLTPPLMVESIALLANIDVVIGSNYVDFVCGVATDMRDIQDILATITAYGNLVETSTQKSHVFLRTAFRIKRSAKSVEGALDKLTNHMAVSVLVIIVTGAILAVISTVSPGSFNNRFISVSVVALMGLGILYIFLVIGVIGYTFSISLIATSVINLTQHAIQWRKKRKFRYIQRAYSN